MAKVLNVNGLVGATEAGRILKIHPDTVRKRAKAGKIPFTKVNGRMMFDPAALQAAQSTTQPVAPVGRMLSRNEHAPVGSRVRIVGGSYDGSEAVVASNDPYGPVVDTTTATGNGKHLDLGPCWGYAFGQCGQLMLLPTAPATTNVTDVVFVLDRSGSMHGAYNSAKENLDKYVEELLKTANENNLYYVSIVNFDDKITVKLRGEAIQKVGQASRYYLDPSGSTRLNDAVDTAISICHDRDDGTRSFLVYVLTDGFENASKVVTQEDLKAKVTACNSTDRYTFAVAGPSTIGAWANRIGIPSGNVTTWDGTETGSRFLGQVTNSAVANYAASRSSGIRNSTSFYASVSQPAEQFAQQLDDKLDDVSARVDVKRVVAGDPREIKKFCLQKWGNFEKGRYYYQLIESEKVQDYKKVIIQDSTTGNFYEGWKAAKKLLGLPNFTGIVRIKPGNLGEFKVFIQSTSVNRKLDPGTAVVRL